VFEIVFERSFQDSKLEVAIITAIAHRQQDALT